MINKICCIGAGFVGGPTMAVLASKCPKIEFKVVDINKEKILKWNSTNLDELPVYEPGLKRLIKETSSSPFFTLNSSRVENLAYLFHGHTSWQSSQP